MSPSSSVTQAEFRKKQRHNLADEFKKTISVFGNLSKNYVEEFRFHETRKWRFDLAYPTKKVAVECDGMVWQAGGGRHNTDADREKINTAVMMGWRVLRFSGNQIRTDPLGCLKILEETLK